MTQPVCHAQHHPARTSLRNLAIVLLLGTGLHSAASKADPEDFQAMPGLWKTDTHVTSHGHAGKSVIKWHCVNESNDPWVEFADVVVPGAKCTRGDEQRTSTSLSWTLSCSGRPPMNGRVDFDSAEHYVATLTTSKDHREIVHVDGIRRAACTDPSD